MNPGPSERANSILVPSGEIEGKPSKLSLNVNRTGSPLPDRRGRSPSSTDCRGAGARTHSAGRPAPDTAPVHPVVVGALDAFAGLDIDRKDRHRGRTFGAIDGAAPGRAW